MMQANDLNTAIAAHREQFTGLSHHSYFNFGGQGPLSQAVLTAITNAYLHGEAIGPFSQAANAWIQTVTEQLRQDLAGVLGADPTTITLTENVTAGCNVPVWGLDWRAGDHVLLSDCEHPGVIAIIQEAQRRHQLEVSTCPLFATLNSGDPVRVIEQHLRPRTRLVVLSHILWNTGQVLPLKAIAQACQSFNSERPIRILVDAAQSVGVLPLNLPELGIDYYAFTGHKWLGGPAGVGGLYIRPEAFTELKPTAIGWRGLVYDQGNPAGWKPDGRRFEVATSAYPLYAGLSAAIQVQREWGTDAERYQRLCNLSQQFWQKLQAIPNVHCLKSEPPESGLVSFKLRQGEPADLVTTLEAQGFFVRLILQPRCIRACTHYLTSEAEVTRLAEAISNYSGSS
ncbi:MAG: aminotransferase class V-fold PLP-dependent enzyme [Cyanobacteria bacterium P01_H01_bin.121]